MALRKADKVAVLAGIPLFASCTKKDLGALASMTVAETVAAGHVLTREGQRGAVAYILVSGGATARRKGRRLGAVAPGSVVGELSLIDGGPRSATVTADESTEVLTLNVDDFRTLVLRSPRITTALLRTIAGRIRDADRRADLRD